MDCNKNLENKIKLLLDRRENLEKSFNVDLERTPNLISHGFSNFSKHKALPVHFKEFSKYPLILILSTQRSGSTLLCRSFSKKLCYSNPDEFFLKYLRNQKQFKSVNEIIEQGFYNNAYGLNIMGNYILHVAKSLSKNSKVQNLEKDLLHFFYSFSSLYIFRLRRKNIVEQAMSRRRARVLKIHYGSLYQYNSPTIPSVSLEELVDLEAILEIIYEIASCELYITSLIERYNLNVVDLFYEDHLANDDFFQKTLSRLYFLLNLDSNYDEALQSKEILKPFRSSQERKDANAYFFEKLQNNISKELIEDFFIKFSGYTFEEVKKKANSLSSNKQYKSFLKEVTEAKHQLQKSTYSLSEIQKELQQHKEINS